MTRSLRRHYKSCGKCHGNERLKRKAFRRLWYVVRLYIAVC